MSGMGKTLGQMVLDAGIVGAAVALGREPAEGISADLLDRLADCELLQRIGVMAMLQGAADTKGLLDRGEELGLMAPGVTTEAFVEAVLESVRRRAH